MRYLSIDYEPAARGRFPGPPLRRAADLLPGAAHLHFNLGRTALLWLCRRLGWGRGDRFLLPAFVCDSLVLPLLAAGVTPEFYAVGADLSVDLGDVERRLAAGARGGLVIHHAGWPQPPAVRRWLAHRPPGAGFWVEDLTHALFTRTSEGPLGTGGDAVLCSYRKLMPTRNGCVLALRQPLGGGDAAGPIAGAPAGFPPPAPESVHILERFDLADAAARRRENACRLLERLSGVPVLAPLFHGVDPGVVPAFLPVRAQRRDRLLAELAGCGVLAGVHWPLPPGLRPDLFPALDRLRAEILTLPVDERYTPADMDALADILIR